MHACIDGVQLRMLCARTDGIKGLGWRATRAADRQRHGTCMQGTRTTTQRGQPAGLSFCHARPAHAQSCPYRMVSIRSIVVKAGCLPNGRRPIMAPETSRIIAARPCFISVSACLSTHHQWTGRTKMAVAMEGGLCCVQSNIDRLVA